MTQARINLALFAIAAAVLAAALPWPAMVLGPRESQSQAVAEAALDQIAAREQVSSPRGYAAFGSGPGERQAALPGLDLGAVEADFTFDATPTADEVLRLRAMSRPEAVAAGRVVPLLRVRILASNTKPGQGGSRTQKSDSAAAAK